MVRTLSKPPTVEDHLDLLRERVFETTERFPHFALLLDDLERIAGGAQAGHRVVSFERTLLYGGHSLIAPLFTHCAFTSVDMSPESADARGGYNAALVDDPRFIPIRTDRRCADLRSALPSASFDWALLPNLVHHVRDQSMLFAEVARILKPSGRAYVFEPLIRELHQVPDDYLRYTPFGLRAILEPHGLIAEKTEVSGGPFEAIAYCWIQALEYVPEAERAAMARWFYEDEFARLMSMNAKWTENQVRPSSTFPVSFSIISRKEDV